MATPPRFPSLSPDQSQNTSREADDVELNEMRSGLEPRRDAPSPRPLSEITLIGTSPTYAVPPYSIGQIDGASGPATTTRSVRFRLDEPDQTRVQRALWRSRIRGTLEATVKKLIFLSYFTSNAAMLIRMAIKASHGTQMQYDEALGWAFLQFLMLIVLLLRYLWFSIMASQMGLPGSLRLAAACGGTLFLGGGLGVLPLFFI
ncbi:uncharacterized protein PV07_06543 [Cladophialophora immunda]|uniref:Uncharacterized protein n=1 Tax=Cladophialophora immunda TaxID=569365 RepID=A0A0D2C6C8_9EURO|nr:uncharacterized protein PV07_06543 [Cladophialophora immunda]KIW26733.1 hypothetical protein PV07_06543 [Cladophialophora immunda]